jgi:hypothetical protein
MLSPGVPYCTEKNTADTAFELATGGPLGSKQENLWVISTGAADLITGQQIPYNQISIGGYGNLDTNGNLYVVLPDNDPANITPHVTATQNYSIGVPRAQKYTLVSQASVPAFANPDLHRTKFGVGEQAILYFSPDITTDADWETSAGGLLHTKYTSNLFTAPSNANPSVVVTAHIKGRTAHFPSFNVVEPNDYKGTILNTNHYSSGLLGAGMTDLVRLLPADVSFYRLSVAEMPCQPSNISGYFTNQTFNPVKIGTASVQADNSYSDLVQSGAVPPTFPIYPGACEFDVTNYWQIAGTTPTYFFKVIPSYFNLINSEGDFSVNKYGITLTRSTNDVSHSTQ